MKTTMRLSSELREELDQMKKRENRSFTSLLEEGGWMLVQQRRSHPLHERINKTLEGKKD